MSVRIVASKDNPVDTISVSVPLFLRLLEYAREEVKNDLTLHTLVENILAAQQDVPLDSSDYDSLIPHVEVSKPKEYDVVLDGARYYLTRSTNLNDYLTSLSGYIRSDKPELAKAFLNAANKFPRFK